MDYAIVEDEGCFEVIDAMGHERYVAADRDEAERWIESARMARVVAIEIGFLVGAAN